jgi:hypothetical protein
MNQKNKDWIEAMEGKEFWTDAFGDRLYERVCVGFTSFLCVVDGKRFIPTNKEVNALREDYLVSEYGTSNIHMIMKMEGF